MAKDYEWCDNLSLWPLLLGRGSELLISRDFATIPIRKTGGGRCLETSFALRSIPRGDAESLH
ncbi:MAG: hypothetical protein PHI97_20215, partial [Desulfobulbus sp.]|nr:hypothetical protein [Desulfobulbus sp.]